MKALFTKMTAFMALGTASIPGLISADDYEVYAGIGYRQDSIRWDMKECPQINPGLKSKLHFEDLEIFFLETKFKGIVGDSFYGRAEFDYGWVCDGKLRQNVSLKSREKTYRFCNNGVAIEGDYNNARSRNRQYGNNYVWDLKVAIGSPFSCTAQGILLAPLVGFSYSRQHLKFHSKDHTHIHVSSEHADILPGSKKGKHSLFNTGWWGPFIGLDINYTTPENWDLFAEIELHFGRTKRDRDSYTGAPLFDNYKKVKNFWGTDFLIGFKCPLCDGWSLEGTASYLYWTSNNHRDHIRWRSGNISGKLAYRF